MANSAEKPPAILFGGRVLEYAVLDQRAAYSGHSYLFVDGKELGPVPRLAICQSAQGEVLLAHCDGDWVGLGVAGGYGSVAQAKKRAERIYPGVSACWVAAQTTEAEAEKYLEELWAGQKCSFCGKRPDQVDQMIEGGKTQAVGTVRICDSCITEYYEILDHDSTKK